MKRIYRAEFNLHIYFKGVDTEANMYGDTITENDLKLRHWM